MDYTELVKALRDDNACLSIKTAHEAADAIEQLQKSICPHYIRNVHDRGDDSLCSKYGCEINALPRWIPVTERLPKPMKYVLLVIRRMGKEFRHDPFISTGYMSINKVDWWCSHDGSCSANHVEVTHWMPLPEPPEEDKL